MGLINVQTIDIRPDCVAEYEDGVRQVAEEAARQDDDLRWQCRQVMAGTLGRYLFVVRAENFAELSRIDSADVLIQRLFGESDGARLTQRLRECSTGARQWIAADRPDLSYLEGVDMERPRPFSAVVQIRMQPGRQEACEELLRKLAEAIPKADDPRRFVSYQTVVGELQTIATVTPLNDISELDDALPPDELLVKAFGRAEGGLVFRNGLEAMQEAERSLLALRTDLSHID